MPFSSSPRRFGRSARQPRPSAAAFRGYLAANGLSVRRIQQIAAMPAEALQDALADPNPASDIAALRRVLITAATPAPRQPVRSGADLALMLMLQLAHLVQEQLVVVCLNSRNCYQGRATVASGNISGVHLRMADIFKPAVRRNSPTILLAHNHPSGLPDPSDADIELTYQCIQAGKHLGISVLDHLIIGAGRWVSMHEWADQQLDEGASG